MTHRNQTIAGLILALILAGAGEGRTALALPGQNASTQSQNPPQPSAWESPAQLRHGVIGGTSGTLRADSGGIEFIPVKGVTQRWPFKEIRSLDLQRHRVMLIGYDNRKWHAPGTRRFDFELKTELTPAVTASFTDEMSRPARNRIPDPDAPTITVIAVRRSEHFGGSNGSLRVRKQGMDYVTAQPGQSRSWRWVDLQTLSSPDPYHLFVFGYRDNYAFDLKEPLSREMFNHISDEIWIHSGSEVKDDSLTQPPSTLAGGGRRAHD